MSRKTSQSDADHHSFQLVLNDANSARDVVSHDIATASGRSRAARGDVELIEAKRLVEIMEQYIGYYASGDSHTAKAKRYDLEHFLGFLGGSCGGPANVLVSDWTLQSTKDFIDDRLKSGEAPATVSRRLATLKHFGRTIAERLPGYINPAREAKSPQAQVLRPKGLSEEQIAALREVAAASESGKSDSGDRFSTLRNRCLLELLLSTGLRADEVRVLTAGQVAPDLCWLKNVQTKGKKFRNVYLPSEIRDFFSTYLEARAEALAAHSPDYKGLTPQAAGRIPLLVSFRGATLDRVESFGLNPKTIWRIISDFGIAASKQAGEHLHPHLLRHTFAHGLLDSSRDVRLVAQALGHSDIRTTMRYTERSDEEISKAVEEKSRR